MYATPDRTVDQRRESLDKANRHRIARADWKKRVKRGQADPLEVLPAPPEELATLKVYDMLRALPKTGEVKAMRLLRLMGISPAKTLGGLSERQRAELVALMERS